MTLNTICFLILAVLYSGVYTKNTKNTIEIHNVSTINQEPPKPPSELTVLDKSRRNVELSWTKPYEESSPLTNYIIEYKEARGTWDHEIVRVIISSSTTQAHVIDLRPATIYNFRVVAENDFGKSQPSNVVTIMTVGDIPSGQPRNIVIEATSQTSLRVHWKPPVRNKWNGEILGYYVGYKTSSKHYFIYETVDSIDKLVYDDDDKEYMLDITHLKTYTQYSVVIQAFNKFGPGPLSDEVKQYTAEGTPNKPPTRISCETLTSENIRVSWEAPPIESVNGVIKEYKVIYAPSDMFNDENNKIYKETSNLYIVLVGLKKYTDYNIEVSAVTSGGDGVRSAPLHCQTDEDVPEAPAAVKALAMSNESILISWRPPMHTNGIIRKYKVYYKSSAEKKSRVFQIQANQLSYVVAGLTINQPYEFWVSACTIFGEGQISERIHVIIRNEIPAKIASFDETFKVIYKKDVKLPCLVVGVPKPAIKWRIKGGDFQASSKISHLQDNSLLIKEVIREDAGDYICIAENSVAKDSITHKLDVLAPPLTPRVIIKTTTTNSITIMLKTAENDISQIQGFKLYYKPEYDVWDNVDVSKESQAYTIENLLCGTNYEVYAIAYNAIGTSEQSEVLNFITTGSKPISPEKSNFIEPSSKSITLKLPEWKDGGCRIFKFVVKLRQKNQNEWTLITDNLKPGGNFVILDLEPSTSYSIRMIASSSAGSTEVEYEAETLTI